MLREQRRECDPGGKKSRCKGPVMSWKNGERLCGQERSEQGEGRARQRWRGRQGLDRWFARGALLLPGVYLGCLCAGSGGEGEGCHKCSEKVPRIQDFKQCMKQPCPRMDTPGSRVTSGCLHGYSCARKAMSNNLSQEITLLFTETEGSFNTVLIIH